MELRIDVLAKVLTELLEIRLSLKQQDLCITQLSSTAFAKLIPTTFYGEIDGEFHDQKVSVGSMY